MTSPPSPANALIFSVMRHMAGELSTAESAAQAGVPPTVIRQLSSEYASYMLPRALRALRWAQENAAAHDDDLDG